MSARLDSPPRGPAELSGLLTELMSLLNRRSAGDALALMNEAGLTMGQMVTLFVLDFLGEHTVGALARKAHLSPAAASHMIDQLVRGGLVERTEDPSDRRAKKIAITRRGRAFIRRLDSERRRELSDVVARFKPRTAARLAEALRDAVEELRFSGECPFPGPKARRAGRQGSA
ncbi:MAG: MarR family winged helix-turn-helix transcriptional regulator [Myxococcales bacterium]